MTNLEIDNKSIEDMIRKINMIFFALLSGLLLFCGVTLYLVEIVKNPVSPELHETLKFVVPLIALFSILAGRMIYDSSLKAVRAAIGKTKQMQYTTANIIKFAFMEGPCIFALVAYLLTGRHSYLLTFAVLISLFLLNKPSELKYREEAETEL